MADSSPSQETNKPTITWVTRTICSLGLLLGGTVAALPWWGVAIPSELNTLAGIVIGGLLSMLTTSKPSTQTPVVPPVVPIIGGSITEAPQKVEVVNTDINPVPVDQAKSEG